MFRSSGPTGPGGWGLVLGNVVDSQPGLPTVRRVEGAAARAVATDSVPPAPGYAPGMSPVEEPDPRPRADAARNRATIITTARVVYRRRGLDAPLDDIARQAGVGNATVYRHFPMRSALVAAAFADSLEENFAEVDVELVNPDAWPGSSLTSGSSAVTEQRTADSPTCSAPRSRRPPARGAARSRLRRARPPRRPCQGGGIAASGLRPGGSRPPAHGQRRPRAPHARHRTYGLERGRGPHPSTDSQPPARPRGRPHPVVRPWGARRAGAGPISSTPDR